MAPVDSLGIVGEEIKPPTELTERFEVYRPVQVAVSIGDRGRITAGSSMGISAI
jgi:hypothetical protein